MSRYIDADKLIERLMHFPLFLITPKNSKDGIIGLSVSRPTANVVEVVRCKDCKYYEIHKPTITLNCEREGKLIPMMPDDYCSHGERKEQ